MLRKFAMDCPAHNSRYLYEGEQALNPAYEAMCDGPSRLSPGDHRIFALRADGIVAVGVKQAESTEASWSKVVTEEVAHLVSAEDRFGHPSLAFSSGELLGVKLAGHLIQKPEGLELLMHSGRYHNDGWYLFHQVVLEIELVRQLRQGYGDQQVRIIYSACGPEPIREWIAGDDRSVVEKTYRNSVYGPEEFTVSEEDEDLNNFIAVIPRTLERILNDFMLRKGRNDVTASMYKLITEHDFNTPVGRYLLSYVVALFSGCVSYSKTSTKEMAVLKRCIRRLPIYPMESASPEAKEALQYIKLDGIKGETMAIFKEFCSHMKGKAALEELEGLIGRIILQDFDSALLEQVGPLKDLFESCCALVMKSVEPSVLRERAGAVEDLRQRWLELSSELSPASASASSSRGIFGEARVLAAAGGGGEKVTHRCDGAVEAAAGL